MNNFNGVSLCVGICMVAKYIRTYVCIIIGIVFSAVTRCLDHVSISESLCSIYHMWME